MKTALDRLHIGPKAVGGSFLHRSFDVIKISKTTLGLEQGHVYDDASQLDKDEFLAVMAVAYHLQQPNFKPLIAEVHIAIKMWKLAVLIMQKALQKRDTSTGDTGRGTFRLSEEEIIKCLGIKRPETVIHDAQKQTMQREIPSSNSIVGHAITRRSSTSQKHRHEDKLKSELRQAKQYVDACQRESEVVLNTVLGAWIRDLYIDDVCAEPVRLTSLGELISMISKVETAMQAQKDVTRKLQGLTFDISETQASAVAAFQERIKRLQVRKDRLDIIDRVKQVWYPVWRSLDVIGGEFAGRKA